MPRSNRYMQAGCLYHLTHRCHNRKFLFRFGVTRNEYRTRLRDAIRRFRVSLLNYSITCNHTHLLAEARTPTLLSHMMHKLEGEFAQWYNRRKDRSGAFWGDRFHCTMVDGGEYVWHCLRYIDLNMVRAGAVSHPGQWRWCGYDELIGRRQRYRLLDLECILKWVGGADRQSFSSQYRDAIEQALVERELVRDPIWTESIAVGSRAFIEKVAWNVRNRVRLEKFAVASGLWTVRESRAAYTPIPGAKMGPKPCFPAPMTH